MKEETVSKIKLDEIATSMSKNKSKEESPIANKKQMKLLLLPHGKLRKKPNSLKKRPKGQKL